MAPEQLAGAEVDLRSDLFGMGVVLHQLLSGKRPFDPAGPYAVISAVLEHSSPELPEASPGVTRVIARALRRAAADRFASAAEMAAALRAAVPGPLPELNLFVGDEAEGARPFARSLDGSPLHDSQARAVTTEPRGWERIAKMLRPRPRGRL
jgi:serine/threonine protein kinase